MTQKSLGGVATEKIDSNIESTIQKTNIKKYDKPSAKYSNIKTADPFAETKKNKTYII